jgi:hypothetical protein
MPRRALASSTSPTPPRQLVASARGPSGEWTVFQADGSIAKRRKGKRLRCSLRSRQELKYATRMAL